jgi:hypothetical protein
LSIVKTGSLANGRRVEIPGRYRAPTVKIPIIPLRGSSPIGRETHGYKPFVALDESLERVESEEFNRRLHKVHESASGRWSNALSGTARRIAKISCESALGAITMIDNL